MGITNKTKIALFDMQGFEGEKLQKLMGDLYWPWEGETVYGQWEIISEPNPVDEYWVVDAIERILETEEEAWAALMEENSMARPAVFKEVVAVMIVRKETRKQVIKDNVELLADLLEWFVRKEFGNEE